MSFGGFDPTAIALLRKLPDWNAKAYAEQKAMLKAGLMDPGAALIEAVAGKLDANLTVVKRSSVSPLHRDLRFAAKDSPRYKDHLLLTTWAGSDKKFAPTLWIRIDSDHVGFASGMGFDPKKRDLWREAVGGQPGVGLAKAIARVEAKGKAHRVEVAGDRLKKVPKGWPQDHPREELLRLGGFQIRFMEPLPNQIGKAAFVSWCVLRLGRLLPIHQWLVRELT